MFSLVCIARKVFFLESACDQSALSKQRSGLCILLQQNENSSSTL
ncbi:unnamed protein product [Staurois parvus]|uniref:Uncharacterized protein n=1 Tax=Staurois parvus TaxID=386267 RepID=A0ABN9DTY0_9NEOB|nr:unnamed protein product [Staurois parvus]